MSSPRAWIAVGVGVIAGAWLLWRGLAAGQGGVAVPEAFTVQQLKEQLGKPDEGAKLFAQYQALTEPQRRQVRENKEQALREMWDDRLDEFFAADAAARQPILDRHLDEIYGEQARRPKDAAEKRKAQGDRGDKPRDWKRPWTAQQRKAKSESASPDTMARTMAYKTALMDRARARGLVPPGGGRKRP